VTGEADPGGDLTRTGVVAAGILMSRVTGFVRTVTVLAALGAGLVGESYNAANVLPNAVYDLLLGGVLSSVVVPLLVTARHEHDDGGVAYTQRLFTLTVVALVAIGAVSVLAAPLLVSIVAHQLDPAQHDLAVRWARLCLPQIPFYGLGTFVGAVLNTRGRYAAPAWAPVANNVIVTGVAAGFLAVVTTAPAPASISSAQVWWIGVGTTTGVIVQTLLLFPALKGHAALLRPRFDWRHTGLARTARLSTWVLVSVLVNQAGLLVVTNLSTAAGTHAAAQRAGHDAGYTVYASAYQLFQVPYAVVAVSVLTVLLPRLSTAAATGRLLQVKTEVSQALRTVAVVLVPAAVGLVVLGPPLAVVLLAHGHLSPASARYIGWVLAVFAVGLVPFTAFQIQTRALYALHDARSPALANAVATGVNILLDLLLVAVLPARHQVAGLALGFSVSYLVAAAGTTLALRRRLGLLDGRRILRTHLQLLTAALAGGLGAVLATRLTTAAAGPSGAEGISVATAAACGIASFLLVSRHLRIAEVAALRTLVRRCLPAR